MAITSYGYPFTIAHGSSYSLISQHSGNRYSVGDFSAFRVTAASSGTRRVNIAAGLAVGKGILVVSDATVTMDLPAPSGNSQWFLVGLKRWADNPTYDPGATPPDPDANLYVSELVYVAGTASRAVPSVPQDAGVEDIQWLALCRVTSASALVQDVVDLRLVSGEGGGGYTTFSDLAMSQLSNIVGAHAYRSDVSTSYERIISPSGALSWRNLSDADTTLSGTSALADHGPGWGRQSDCRMWRRGTQRTAVFVLKNNGSKFSSGRRGGLSDARVGVMHAVDNPRIRIPLDGDFVISGLGSYAASGHISVNGNVILNSTVPDLPIANGDILTLTGTWEV